MSKVIEPSEKVTELIRKCLALATSPNENEAAAAMAKAQELLEKYNLDIEQIKISKPEETDLINATYPCNHSSWERTIFSVVAVNNFCRIIGMGDKIAILGRKVNMFATVEMAQWLIEQIEVITAREMRNYTNSYIDETTYRKTIDYRKESKQSYRTGFITGVIYNIAAKLKELRNDREVQNPKITALTINLSKETQIFVSQQFPVLCQGRQFGNSHSQGFSHGYKAGNDVSMVAPSHHVGGGILRLAEGK